MKDNYNIVSTYNKQKSKLQIFDFSDQKQTNKMNKHKLSGSDHSQVFYISDQQQLQSQYIAQNNQNQETIYKFGNLQITIDDYVTSQMFLNFQTQFYHIVVQGRTITDQIIQFQIGRRYTDFQWLYQALSMTFPGYILAYFPVKTIQSFFVQKLNSQWNINKVDLTITRRKQLQQFLQGIQKNNILRNSRQFGIFFSENDQLFKKLKNQYLLQLEESYSYQSKSLSLTSIFQRSMAWITQNKEVSIVIQQSNEWKKTEEDIKKWVFTVVSILQKIQKLIILKLQQTKWSGPQTQIQIIQKLKVKVISGRQFTQILLNQLKSQILPLIQQQVKNLKQIQNQLNTHQDLLSIIGYLKKSNGNQNRIQKLLRKKNKFQNNMIQQWLRVDKIRKIFENVWMDYNQKMRKIWK